MSDLLSIRKLNISFRQNEQWQPAVRDLDLNIPVGKVVGLVGESGSGKSVTSLSILRLLQMQSSSVAGEIFFQNRNLLFNFFFLFDWFGRRRRRSGRRRRRRRRRFF